MNVLPIVGAADNSFAVESDTSHEFLMTFQDPQTSSTVHVP